MSDYARLTVFIGTGACDADCLHCAGRPYLGQGPQSDERLREVLRAGAAQGACSLSLTGSGEPTLAPDAVTRTLTLLNDEGLLYERVALYTNGIRIGSDEHFARTALPAWRRLGLTTLSVTAHGATREENARGYRVAYYPPLQRIIARAHDAELTVRANLLLTERNCASFAEATTTIARLRSAGADAVAAWPLRTLDDAVAPDAPPAPLLAALQAWAPRQRFPIRVDGYRRGPGTKRTLLPDGTLAEDWCTR